MASQNIRLSDIQAAQKRIAPYIQKTPLRRWEYLRRKLGHEAPVFLKLETFQNTGSFKVRGAANKITHMIEQGEKLDRVIAASAGNHAQAAAYIAGQLNIKSTIVMPEGTPLVKAAATADYGADVVLHGTMYDEAYEKAMEILKNTPRAAYVHAYADPDIIAGQGTTGLEIHEQLLEQGVNVKDDIQVIVPIGGGGLMSGVAIALQELRPSSKFYGVVSEVADSMATSLESGTIQPSKKGRTRTIAEGLAVKSVNPMTFEIIKERVSKIAIVTDDEVAQAIFYLMERGKLVAEGAGAAGVAAAISKKLPLDPKKPLVIAVCGGNIDMHNVATILDRALTQDERLLSIDVMVEDRPGQLAKITHEISLTKANVLDIYHDRIGVGCPVGYTRIRFRLETRGSKHARELCEKLEASGYAVKLG